MGFVGLALLAVSSFDLETLEYPKVLELMQRFLISPLARYALDRLRPFSSEEAMRRAQAQVRELHGWLEEGGRLPLSALPDLLTWLEAVRSSQRRVRVDDLAGLLKALRQSARVRRIFSEMEDRPALAQLGERMPELAGLLALLENSIDERGELLSSASPKLAAARDEISKAESAIHAAIQRTLQDPMVRKGLQTPQVAWRHGRPALQVKAEGKRWVRGIVHDRSQSGQTIFIEPEAAVEPANRLADARAEESAEIARILAELVQEILRQQGEVRVALEGLAWLDFSNARVRLVRELGFVVPETSESGVFRVRDGRHPLLLLPLWKGEEAAEALREQIVPLDLDLGDPFTMLVVTGPNTGGKTVALKTLGLLVLMAQSGLPVPAAAGTALPFVDGVYADIGDEQSIEQSLSTFSSHMTRIARILSKANSRSLVLLDELGAGTDPEEGGALGYGILETLHAAQIPSVATTHLGRLKDFAYQHAGVENGAMAFDPDELRPLYRLDVGLPGSSQALVIAERVGLPAELLERARRILGDRDTSLDDMIGRIQRTRKAAEEHRRAAETRRRQVESDEGALREREEELSLKSAWLQEEAEQFVDEELRAARDMLQTPMKQFLGAPAPFNELAKGMLELLGSLLHSSALGRRREKYVEGVKKGEFVYVPRFRRRCKVLKNDRKKKLLAVELGALRMDLPWEDVSWLQALDTD
ncbi:MAG: endonuclease MutS2 [Planctomycetota bacterium]|nr:MAG: endonuclease MutS2 [Planctomycetota bacterium]